jgi:predicted ribosome quality control (RQC) complex YloA/Tae2 family protein
MKLKKFISTSGLEILVGIDDESNDELTFRVARPNDLWFHVNGAPGSHVVLRCQDSAQPPDKKSVQEAAALAAWFSKLRQGGNVSVHYCEARQVSKPRGVKAGSVNIRQFKKIIVKPALLPEQQPGESDL